MKAKSEPTDLYLIQQTRDSIQTFRLNLGEAFVGRNSSSDIYLPDRPVSRKHARLQVTADRVEVQDLDSHNGTFVNENRVKKGVLSVGEKVRFGSVTLYLCRDSSSESDDGSDESTRTILQNHLTPAQSRVFSWLITGIPEKQIARELKLSGHTIHNHTRAIYAKFKVRSRAELIRLVFRLPDESSEE